MFARLKSLSAKKLPATKLSTAIIQRPLAGFARFYKANFQSSQIELHKAAEELNKASEVALKDKEKYENLVKKAMQDVEKYANLAKQATQDGEKYKVLLEQVSITAAGLKDLNSKLWTMPPYTAPDQPVKKPDEEKPSERYYSYRSSGG